MARTVICGVYTLTFPLGIYVGSSKNVSARFREHRNKLKTKLHHNSLMMNEFARYGLPTMEIILCCGETNLRYYEQLVIDALRPELNMTPTADRMSHTVISKEKIRQRKLGTKASKETRAKMRASHKSRPPITEETRKKLRAAWLRHSSSKIEIARKMGLGNRGRKHSESAKRKMSKTRKRLPLSPAFLEAREKYRDSIRRASLCQSNT